MTRSFVGLHGPPQRGVNEPEQAWARRPVLPGACPSGRMDFAVVPDRVGRPACAWRSGKDCPSGHLLSSGAARDCRLAWYRPRCKA